MTEPLGEPVRPHPGPKKPDTKAAVIALVLVAVFLLTLTFIAKVSNHSFTNVMTSPGSGIKEIQDTLDPIKAAKELTPKPAPKSTK